MNDDHAALESRIHAANAAGRGHMARRLTVLRSRKARSAAMSRSLAVPADAAPGPLVATDFDAQGVPAMGFLSLANGGDALYGLSNEATPALYRFDGGSWTNLGAITGVNLGGATASQVQLAGGARLWLIVLERPFDTISYAVSAYSLAGATATLVARLDFADLGPTSMGTLFLQGVLSVGGSVLCYFDFSELSRHYASFDGTAWTRDDAQAIPQGNFGPWPLTLGRLNGTIVAAANHGAGLIACANTTEGWSPLPVPGVGDTSLPFPGTRPALVAMWNRLYLIYTNGNTQCLDAAAFDGHAFSAATPILGQDEVSPVKQMLGGAALFEGKARLVSSTGAWASAIPTPPLTPAPALAGQGMVATLGGQASCSGQAGDLTVEAWVQPVAGSPLGTIASWGLEDSSAGDGWALFWDPNSNEIVFVTRAGDVIQWVNAGAATLGFEGWHHVAAVRNVEDKTLLLYFDGRLAATAGPFNVAMPDLSGAANAGLFMGQGGLTGPDTGGGVYQGGTFFGAIAELRVWSCARSVAEIDAAMYHVPRTQIPDLVGRWGFADAQILDSVAGGAGWVLGGFSSFGETEFAMVLGGSPYVCVQAALVKRPRPVPDEGGGVTEALVREWAVALDTRNADGTPYLGDDPTPAGGWVELWLDQDAAVWMGDIRSEVPAFQVLRMQCNLRGRANLGIEVDPETPTTAPTVFIRPEFMLTGAIVAHPDRAVAERLATMGPQDVLDSRAFDRAWKDEDDATRRARAVSVAKLMNRWGQLTLPTELEQPDLDVPSQASARRMALRRSATGAALNTMPISHAYLAVDLPVVSVDPTTDVLRCSYMPDVDPRQRPRLVRTLNANHASFTWAFDFDSCAYYDDPQAPEAQRAKRDDSASFVLYEVSPSSVSATNAARSATVNSAGRAQRQSDDALQKLAGETEHWYDWLGYLFDIDDMRETGRSMSVVAEALKEKVKDLVRAGGAQVNTALASLAATIDSSFDAFAAQLLGDTGANASMSSAAPRSSENTLPGELLTDEAGDTLSEKPPQPASTGGASAAKWAAAQAGIDRSSHKDAVENLAKGPALTRDFSDPAKLLRAGLSWLVRVIKDIVTGAIKLLSDAVTAIVELVVTVIDEVWDLLKTPVPVASWLLGKIVGVKNPSFLDLALFACGAIGTVAVKLFGDLEGPLLSRADADNVVGLLRGGRRTRATTTFTDPQEVSLAHWTIAASWIFTIGAIFWTILLAVDDVKESKPIKYAIAGCEFLCLVACFPVTSFLLTDPSAGGQFVVELLAFLTLAGPLAVDFCLARYMSDPSMGPKSAVANGILGAIQIVVFSLVADAHFKGVEGKAYDKWLEIFGETLMNLAGSVAVLVQILGLSKHPVTKAVKFATTVGCMSAMTLVSLLRACYASADHHEIYYSSPRMGGMGAG